jgi:hypothetical protein
MSDEKRLSEDELAVAAMAALISAVESDRLLSLEPHSELLDSLCDRAYWFAQSMIEIRENH